MTLLLAAISSQNKGQCTGLKIKVESNRTELFIDEKDIQKTVERVNGGKIRSKSVASFDLQLIEKELKRNSWVKEAEVYFDNQDVLHVNITEKEPVARIFTESGRSYYIDGSGKKMPLSDKQSARLPVFTGYPDIKKMNASDSMLLDHVTTTARFILHDPFWMSQVAQVNITNDRSLEVIPLVGNHLIRLGDGEDVAGKFHRLFVFYQQVLRKTGFEKYKTIDVRFKGQVVASAQEGDIKVDAKQHRKYVERLIKESNEVPDENIIKAAVKSERYDLRADSATAPAPELNEIEKKNEQKRSGQKKIVDEKKQDDNSVSEKDKRSGIEKKEIKKKPEEEKRTPKAIMPPRKTPEEEDNGGYN